MRVTPRMRGTLDGAAFALEGTTVPFAERREATLDVDLDALPLPDYVAWLPSKPPLGLASGTLTTRLKVVFVDAGANDRRLELRGEARVDRPALVRADGSAVLAADRLAVALERVDVFGRDARLASVAIDARRASISGATRTDSSSSPVSRPLRVRRCRDRCHRHGRCALRGPRSPAVR